VGREREKRGGEKDGKGKREMRKKGRRGSFDRPTAIFKSRRLCMLKIRVNYMYHTCLDYLL